MIGDYLGNARQSRIRRVIPAPGAAPDDERFIPPMRGEYFDIVLFRSDVPILEKLGVEVEGIEEVEDQMVDFDLCKRRPLDTRVVEEFRQYVIQSR